jgi:LPS O-antigen subunit length determinant protein (WzzB/FepE family)
MTDSQSRRSDPHGSDGTPSREPAPPRDDEITLMELLVTLSRGRGLIVLCILGMGLLGLLYSFSLPTEYTATAKVFREAGEDGGGGLPGGLGGLSQGLGINIGGSSVGLTPGSYPEIATSREVRLAVARDTFYFPSTGRRTTFVDHVNRPAGLWSPVLDYTLYLPWTLKGALGMLMQGSKTQLAGMDSTGTVIYPTEEEEAAIQALEAKISASVSESGALEEGSGLMTISTSSGGPTLAARLNEHVIEHLRTRVREIRTENTRKNLQFIQERFAEVDEELDAAEERLSQFMERNRSVLSGGNEPQLEFRREQLRREVRFKEQLYSQLQEQVTQTRLKLQKEQPVVTIAERPTPPTSPSAPSRMLIVAFSLFLGGLLGFGGVFLRGALKNDENEEQEEQIREIKEAMTLEGIAQGVKQEIGLSNLQNEVSDAQGALEDSDRSV